MGIQMGIHSTNKQMSVVAIGKGRNYAYISHLLVIFKCKYKYIFSVKSVESNFVGKYIGGWGRRGEYLFTLFTCVKAN